VVDIYQTLSEYTANITIYDPKVNPCRVQEEYGLAVINELPVLSYDVIILAVAHQEILALDLTQYKHEATVIYDVKGVLDRTLVDGRL
jgi:UDP-N-acetyl-D-galactosamine dehydrogenase